MRQPSVCLSVRMLARFSRKNGWIFQKNPKSDYPYKTWGNNVGALILASEAILRPLEAIFDLKLQKETEGSIFWGYIIKQKMFLDLKLWGPSEIKSDLRGHWRPFQGQIPKTGENTSFLHNIFKLIIFYD